MNTNLKSDNVPAPRKLLLRKGKAKYIFKNPTGILGITIVSITLFIAIFANFLMPHDPFASNLGARLLPPSTSLNENFYVLGTDQLGRDLLSRIMYGARISLIVGIFGVLISLVIGTILGLLAGYFGKWLDDFIMRAADIQLAFPFILFAILIMSVLGTGIWKIVIILGLTYWVGFARLIRSQVISLKEMEYIQAARATGSSGFKIVYKHILPSVIPSVLVLSSLYTAEFILLEASLTFLGLGVDPTIPSWGGMLADSRNYIETAWWIVFFPGLAIMFTVMGFNLLGDWLRDKYDPNLK